MFITKPRLTDLDERRQMPMATLVPLLKAASVKWFWLHRDV
jgi:hypothetical protein